MIFLLLFVIYLANAAQPKGSTRTLPKLVIIETRLSIEEVEVKDGVLETTVEAVLALAQNELTTSNIEVLLLPVDQQQHPFTDIQFASEEQQTIGSFRAVTKADGRIVAMKERKHLKTSCPLSKRFPFDGRTCEIRLTSVRQQASSLLLRFHPSSSSITLSPTITTSKFHLMKVTPESCMFDTVYAILTDSVLSARHSCVIARFSFSSPLIPSLIRYFLPPLIGPFIAWLNLFTPRYNLLLRFGVLSTSIFIIFLSSLISQSTPPSPSFTPLDQWYFIVSIVVFLFIIEFFITSSLIYHSHKYRFMSTGNGESPVRMKSRQRIERKESRKLAISMNNDVEKSGCYSSMISEVFLHSSDRFSLIAARIDITARFALPSILILLITIFFFFHLYVLTE
ncbi:hypothetical protein PRIPAC_77762 [Pristionchus pacificus]|uniref:Transmembrane ion channel n=1 Tax=Pristionchus pacificus TaxID=54126 RepID=A0A2A6BE66_PRIPA|nr:hypothetical protein PRIPAC_77762 [Pristionchus pacificus]|eukprot:PDM64177.1 transmembrane ion channel [Pristionchus pacificus]